MASDTAQIQRTIVALGLIAAFAVLMYAEMGIPGGPPSISTPAYPTFANPFDATLQVVLPVVADSYPPGPASATDNGATPSCTTATTPTSNFWGCVSTHDGTTSYVTVDATNSAFEVTLAAADGIPGGLPVLGVLVDTQCRAVGGTNETITYTFNSPGFTVTTQGLCVAGSGYTDTSSYNQFDYVHPTVTGFSGSDIQMTVSTPFTADVSFIKVTLVYGTTAECSSGNSLTYIGCIISGFVDFFVKLGRLAFNAVIYVFSWVFVIASFIASVFGILAWLFAIPGVPPEIQLVLDALLSAMAFVLLFNVAKLVRGNE